MARRLLKGMRIALPDGYPMKNLTFFCLSCRRQSLIEILPVICAHCGSRNGLIRRW
jgi:Zn finger protein HypA/HybF involved in hydrogenase expression